MRFQFSMFPKLYSLMRSCTVIAYMFGALFTERTFILNIVSALVNLPISRGARDSKIEKKWPESSRILDYIMC